MFAVRGPLSAAVTGDVTTLTCDLSSEFMKENDICYVAADSFSDGSSHLSSGDDGPGLAGLGWAGLDQAGMSQAGPGWDVKNIQG